MNTAHKYLDYVDWVGQGTGTRKQAAEAFGVSKSTATYHLEKGVAEGLLKRFYAYADNNQTGWGYMLASQPELELPFADNHEGYDEHAPYEGDDDFTNSPLL